MAKHTLLLLSILAVVLIAGCAEKPLVGVDKDEHGCIASAGYRWCESLQVCVRTWETPCPGMVTSFKECEILNYTISDADPRQCTTPEGATFTEELIDDSQEESNIDEVMAIAQDTECTEKGTLTDIYNYNKDTRTWWINLDMKEEFEKDTCYPACVVNEDTKTAEINWRCTGEMPPPE